MKPNDPLARLDRDLDAFLEQRLCKDAEMMRRLGADDHEVRDFLNHQRSAYEDLKVEVLAKAVSFVERRPMVGDPPLQ